MDGERYLNLLSNLEIFWVDIHQIRFIRNSFFPTVLSNFVRRCLEICCIRAWWVTLQMWKSWTLTAPTCLPFFSLHACVVQKTWAGTSRNKQVPLSLILQIKHLFHKGNLYIYIFIYFCGTETCISIFLQALVRDAEKEAKKAQKREGKDRIRTAARILDSARIVTVSWPIKKEGERMQPLNSCNRSRQSLDYYHRTTAKYWPSWELAASPC